MRIATQKTYPSFGYWIANGATVYHCPCSVHPQHLWQGHTSGTQTEKWRRRVTYL